MGFLKKLFQKKSTFVGDFVRTGDALLDLAASNPIVSAELERFEKRLKDRDITCKGNQEKEAFKSAEALSGYGISVDAKAFLETLT